MSGNEIIAARLDRLEKWAWGNGPAPIMSPMKVRILVTRTIWFWQAERFSRDGWTVQTSHEVRHPLNPLMWLEILFGSIWPTAAKTHFEEVA